MQHHRRPLHVLSSAIGRLELAVELLSELLVNLLEEGEGLEVVRLVEVLAVDSKGKVLGHLTALNSLNACLLESLSKDPQVIVVIELGTVGETASPGKDGRDGVGGGGLALLILTPVASDSAVGSLSLNSLAVRADKDRGHETERAISLSDNVGLDITVVVLAGPDHAAGGLESLSDLIIDETVLVPDAGSLELGLVLSLVDGLEGVLEKTIVLLEDGVLSGEVERPLLHEGVLEARVGETADRIHSVVHGQATATLGGEVKDLPLGGLAAIRGSEADFELAGLLGDEVGGLVLVTEGMATNHNGLGPARDETRNVLHHNGLTEDGTTKNVADSAVGGEPHLLEVELLHAILIGGNGGTLDTNVVLLDGLSSLNGNLVISGITVGETEIVVLDVKVEVGKNELLLNVGPDDAGHFITIEIHNGVRNLDLASSGSSEGTRGSRSRPTESPREHSATVSGKDRIISIRFSYGYSNIATKRIKYTKETNFARTFFFVAA